MITKETYNKITDKIGEQFNLEHTKTIRIGDDHIWFRVILPTSSYVIRARFINDHVKGTIYKEHKFVDFG